MAKTNEFDELFGNVPVTASANAKTSESTTLGSAAETPAASGGNEFDDLFPPEGHVAPKALEESLSPAHTAGAVAAGVGATYGALKAKPSGDNAYSRWAEKAYGLPKGSLAELQMLREPATPPTVGQAAGVLASKYSTDARMPQGSTGNMPFNYAKAAGLTDIEAARAKDMTKNVGGTHDLTTKRRIALEQLARSNPTFAENPAYGGIMLDTSTGGGARGAPRAAIPAQAVVPPSTLSDIQRNIEKANATSRGGQRLAGAGRGAIGSGLTALQAYGMAGDMAQGKTPSWQDWFSLVGGPMASFGGKIAGPLGMAAQIPYAIKNREAIAKGMTMGDVMSPNVLSGSEMFEPAFPDLIDPRSAYPGQGRTR